MPECTRAGLISDRACFSGTRLSEHDQLVRRVYFDLLQLAAIGGTDYADDITGLNVDATNLSCGFQPDDFDAAELVIAKNNATAAGATVPDDVELAAAVNCLKNYTPFQLKQMKLLLYCQLGQGATQE